MSDKVWPTYRVLLSWFLWSKSVARSVSSRGIPTIQDFDLWLIEFNNELLIHWHELLYEEYEDFRNRFLSPDNK